MQIAKLVGLCIIYVFIVGCSTTDYYFVVNAELVKPEISGNNIYFDGGNIPAALLLNGHHVRPGSRTVLLIRRFDIGGVLTTDDENYEKISIEINNYSIGVPVAINSTDVFIYYSTGSSGYIYKGHGVYAHSGLGKVTIQSASSTEITAEILFTGSARPAGDFPFEEETIRIHDTVVFKKREFSDLTPWLGTPGKSIGNEVYP